MSPFTVQASAGACHAQPLASMAYSLDNNNDTVIRASNLVIPVKAAAGTHTLHVKSWGDKGAFCSEDIEIEVLAKMPSIPANVSAISDIQNFTNWVGEHDAATPGDSSGSTAISPVATFNGQPRQFSFHYANDGGQRFHVSFPANATATHFVYDTYLMVDKYCGGKLCGNLANVEMDMNQVLENHNVVIYGVQCDGWSGTWDYTVNDGTVAHTHSTWIHSNVQCDPRKWSKDTLHHEQFTYFRDDNGNVTYESVAFDGAESSFANATGPSLFGLNWGPVLLANFQMDGQGAKGTQTMEMANTSVYAW